MLCDKCKKNEATVHIKEFHNGKCTDLHLCNDCAGAAGQDIGGAQEIGFNLAEVLFNVNQIAEKISASDRKKTPAEKKSCPVCSWTADDIRHHDGKVGCPECYKTFQNLIKQAIAQVQRGSLHLGKRPKGAKSDSPAVKRNELNSLKKELQDLITREEYEAAAICRDRINILKAELEIIEDGGEK